MRKKWFILVAAIAMPFAAPADPGSPDIRDQTGADAWRSYVGDLPNVSSQRSRQSITRSVGGQRTARTHGRIGQRIGSSIGGGVSVGGTPTALASN